MELRWAFTVRGLTKSSWATWALVKPCLGHQLEHLQLTRAQSTGCARGRARSRGGLDLPLAPDQWGELYRQVAVLGRGFARSFRDQF